ncbi:MAG TPA: CBS domain-containing protein [Actinomycetota bacterium]|nr:CBS domain-containing protein [Actinomycetota bacterium]
MHDYASGKQDWLAAGLPTEGRVASWPRAGKVARADPPTCRLDDRVGDVTDRAEAAGWDLCVVVNEERVVLGLLRSEQLRRDRDGRVEEAMRPGPSTFRPHVPIVEMAQVMIDHDVSAVPITTGEGVLVGVLRREDAARAALEWRREHGEEHDHG